MLAAMADHTAPPSDDAPSPNDPDVAGESNLAPEVLTIPSGVTARKKSAAFRRHPQRYIRDTDAAAAALVRHLDRTSGQFDMISMNSDPARIEAADIVAVSMLSFPVSPVAAAWLLSSEGQWLTTEILADIPVNDQLWNCDIRSILRAADLFQLLRAESSQFPQVTGSAAMGQATATRLLAAKRPRLVPIDDREVRDALRYPKDSLWFRRWQETLDDELLVAARAVRAVAAKERPVAAELSELRVIDAVVRRRIKKPRSS